ncbi:hypothetical protein [Streptomyces sp. PA5.6]|uniref:hypothetical protein n=1 Tax=Streptomyces sp. PA5.6 TaxID=3035651 RepID=UPI0039047D2F
MGAEIGSLTVTAGVGINLTPANDPAGRQTVFFDNAGPDVITVNGNSPGVAARWHRTDVITVNDNNTSERIWSEDDDDALLVTGNNSGVVAGQGGIDSRVVGSGNAPLPRVRTPVTSAPIPSAVTQQARNRETRDSDVGLAGPPPRKPYKARTVELWSPVAPGGSREGSPARESEPVCGGSGDSPDRCAVCWPHRSGGGVMGGLRGVEPSE